MDPVEEALEWLFSKSEDETVADAEGAILYDLFFSEADPSRRADGEHARWLHRPRRVRHR